MNQANALYKLQQIELDILRQNQELQEIKKLLEDNDAVQAAKDAHQAAQDTLKPLQTQQRDLELQIQATQEKRKATDERLYSGAVKNPKELQDMQNEIAALQKRESELEDQMLVLMDAVETAQAAFETAESQLAAITETWENDHIEFLEQQEALQASITQGLESRREALKPIDKAILKTYNALRPKKGNQPVSVLQDNSCSACGIELTLAVTSEAKREQDLVNCPNCGRILVILH